MTLNYLFERSMSFRSHMSKIYARISFYNVITEPEQDKITYNDNYVLYFDGCNINLTFIFILIVLP